MANEIKPGIVFCMLVPALITAILGLMFLLGKAYEERDKCLRRCPTAKVQRGE